MIKFFKKYKLNIITFLFCSFAMVLFTIVSFSCKTYAYTIDSNGNLVGDNLIKNDIIYDNNGITFKQENGIYYINGTSTTTIYISLYQATDIIVENNLYTINVFNTSINNDIQIQVGANGTAWNRYSLDEINKTLHINMYNSLLQMYLLISNNTTLNNFSLNPCLLNGNVEIDTFEPYGVWYSKSNYDTLNNNYDILQDSYDSLSNLSQYGWLKYIDNLDLSIGGSLVDEFSFNELITNNYITNNKINVYDLSRLSNPNYTYSTIDIYFNDTFNNTDYFSYSLFGLTSNGNYCNSTISIYDDDGNVAVFEFTDAFVVITPGSIMDKNNLFNGNIYSVKIYNSSPDSAINFFTDSNYGLGYQSGYNYGIAYGTNYYTPIINDLNGKISNLENDVKNLTSTIDSLKDLNSQLQEQIADNLGWSNLFFAFADTPFKVVSNVLGFELFGLNLFATFIGMITVFGVVYLLKKFF